MTTDATTVADRWIETYRSESGDTQTYDLNGIAWHAAPLPPWRHTCTPQTRGYLHYFRLVERCACGAITMDGQRPFMEKNSTRKGRGEKAPRRWWSS